MSQVKTGDTVRFHFTCKLEDGTANNWSRGGDPVELVIGSGDAPPGFERSMLGMIVGETRTVVVAAEQALGPHRSDLVETFERSKIAGGKDLLMGAVVEILGADDRPFPAIIVGLTDETVTLDSNHPLAGKQLNFEIELVAIVSGAC